MTGYALDELRQMNVSQLLVDAAPDGIDASNDGAGRRVHYRHRSGRTVPVVVSVRTVRDADGREVHAVGPCRT